MNRLFNRKILITDNDSKVSAALSQHFEWLGNFCRIANSLKDCKRILNEEKFDIVVSESTLPDGDAIELFANTDLPPVIIFSSRNDDDEIIELLSAGAVDYILKPCSPCVMAARIGIRLPPLNRIIVLHGLSLDIGKRTLFYNEKPVKLTSSEFNILHLLMSYPGKFFTADEIYEKVWNASSMQTSVVRFHISNLKKTLFAVTGKTLIVSEFGTGYSFAP